MNELAARIDALLSCTIEGARVDPPIGAPDGQCWIVAQAPTGEWAGQTDKLAIHVGGTWRFLTPPEGLIVYDRSRGAMRRFAGSWLAPQLPNPATGGAVIDVEARAAISAIVALLQAAGTIPLF